MSAEKRKVSTDALETLGTIITDGGRDAIHLAVEPVVAGELLNPGQDIGIKDGKAYGSFIHKLGIADPFLKSPIQAGEKFWLVVYPRQITSLRHVWSHPDFPESEPIKDDNSDLIQQSKAWIRDYAENLGLTYKELMDGAEDYQKHGEYLCKGGTLEGEYTSEEFWYYYAIVTGQPIKSTGNFFTCSC